MGGAGNDMLQAVGDSNALIGGDGNDQLQANGGSNTLDGGTDNDSLFVAAGTATMLSGRRRKRLAGLQRQQSCSVRRRWQRLDRRDRKPAQLYGGSGDDSLLGVGDSHILFGGDGNDWVGVSGINNVLLGDAGSDYLAATGNFSTFNGGTGNDQMVAAAGHLNNRYIFEPGSGQDLITGFEGGNDDVVDLRGFGLADFAALQPFISQVGADTVITLNGADILTLKNIASATLVADDFLFA